MDPLHTVLAHIRDLWGTPGLAAGLIDGNQTVSYYLGDLRVDQRRPVNCTTIFCPASMCKVVTAAAVMQLVERGSLLLDMPAIHYLPDFTMADDRVSQVTIRQLLSHTAGMPDESEASYNRLFAHPEFDEDASRRYIHAQREKQLLFAPGERFSYSNIGYSLLGYLVTQVSGVSFERYVQENLLAPCEMLDSTFLLSEVDRARLAMPHIRAPHMQVSPIFPYHRADAPGSSLHTTLEDLFNWARMCLSSGEIHGRRVLQPASFDQMWSLHYHRGGRLYRDMGLAWNLGSYQGANVISHGGGGAGYMAFLALLPERRQAAVLLLNEESEVRQRYLYALLDTLLGREPQVGPVSWLVPVSRALAESGLPAARDTAHALLEEQSPEVEIDEGSLVRLGQQLVLVGKVEEAVSIFQLNLEVFPDSDFTRECLESALADAGGTP